VAGLRNLRSLGLALLALALFTPSASAAVIEIRENGCGRDGSSGDEDTHGDRARRAR